MDAEAPRPEIGQRLLQLGLDVVEAALMVLEVAEARMREPPDCGPRYVAAVAKLEQSLADYDAAGILNALYHLGHAARDGEALRLFQRGEKKRARAGAQKRGEQHAQGHARDGGGRCQHIMTSSRRGKRFR